MSTLNLFFVFKISTLVIIAVILGGCLDDDGFCHTGGKDCNVFFSGVECFVESAMQCREISKSRGCGGARFKTGPTKFCPNGNECDLNCCPLCSSRAVTMFDRQIAESDSPLTIVNIEQTCDVVAKDDIKSLSDQECEIFANNRMCKGFDLVESEEDDSVIKCLLYECEECDSDFPNFNEDIFE